MEIKRLSSPPPCTTPHQICYHPNPHLTVSPGYTFTLKINTTTLVLESNQNITYVDIHTCTGLLNEQSKCSFPIGLLNRPPTSKVITAELEIESYPKTFSLELTSSTLSQNYLKYGLDPLTIRILNPTSPTPHPQPGVLTISRGTHGTYGLKMYLDDMNVRKSHWREIGSSDTGRNVNFMVNIKISSYLEYQLRLMLKQVFTMIDNTIGASLGTSEANSILDELKYYTSDRYLWRFLLTSLISFMHMYLSYKASAIEIKYYYSKNRKGVSLSSVRISLISEIIIFLYLLDGSSSGKIVLASVFSDVCVQGFKYIKLSRFIISTNFPYIKEGQEEEEEESDFLDTIALKYSTIFLTPIFIGLMLFNYKFYIYSSTYSFLIDSLADCVYFFGFIKMTPQIYVNWKLKSVTHLTGNMMVYKIFNTFVDDAFAWLVDSPVKWKVMCLRDDVIFGVLCYQKWVYKTDYGRENDFGIVFEEERGRIEGEKESIEGEEEVENMIEVKDKKNR